MRVISLPILIPLWFSFCTPTPSPHLPRVLGGESLLAYLLSEEVTLQYRTGPHKRCVCGRIQAPDSCVLGVGVELGCLVLGSWLFFVGEFMTLWRPLSLVLVLDLLCLGYIGSIILIGRFGIVKFMFILLVCSMRNSYHTSLVLCIKEYTLSTAQHQQSLISSHP